MSHFVQEKVPCNNFRALGGEIHGPAGFIAFTRSRARVIKQRIGILLHEFCAGSSDDCKTFAKE